MNFFTFVVILFSFIFNTNGRIISSNDENINQVKKFWEIRLIL
jgi:hypothetical protein